MATVNSTACASNKNISSQHFLRNPLPLSDPSKICGPLHFYLDTDVGKNPKICRIEDVLLSNLNISWL